MCRVGAGAGSGFASLPPSPHSTGQVRHCCCLACLSIALCDACFLSRDLGPSRFADCCVTDRHGTWRDGVVAFVDDDVSNWRQVSQVRARFSIDGVGRVVSLSCQGKRCPHYPPRWVRILIRQSWMDVVRPGPVGWVGHRLFEGDGGLPAGALLSGFLQPLTPPSRFERLS